MDDAPPTSRLRALAAGAAGVLGAIALVWAAIVALAGGVTLRVAGARLSSTDPVRVATAAIVLLVVAAALAGLARTRVALSRAIAGVTPASASAIVAIGVAAAGLAYGTWTASGPDSFAYVSQASLWRSGVPRLEVPLAAEAPWPAAVRTFMPFGYRPAPADAATLVPVTSPGLPLAMAVARTLGGHRAVFVITPLAGALAVWMTFLLGARVVSPRAGLIAALLVASCPVLLFMLMWPMTDVPAAAIVVTLVWLLVRSPRRVRDAALAGLTAGVALLLRPNLVLVSAAAGAWLVLDAIVWTKATKGWPRVLAFAAGCVPAVALTLFLNDVWYGSPFASGYGSAGSLLSVSRVGTNLARYGTWLGESAPLMVVGIAALVWPRARWWTRAADGARLATLSAMVVAATGGLYLLYAPYDAWWYSRFLLPMFPVLAVAAAVLLEWIGVQNRAARTAATGVVLFAVAGGITFAATHGVFESRYQERRFATIARLVAQVTEPGAVIVTVQHSGTVRYYAGRETLRWDELDSAWLDRAIDWLRARGRHPYILLEDTEQPTFERRFPTASGAPRLTSYAAVMAWQSTRVPGWVWLYDPLRRDAVTLTVGPEFERAQPWCVPPAAGW